MKLVTLRSKLVVTCVLVFLAVSLGVANGPVSASDSPKHATCQASEYREFDFWVGDWGAFDIGSTIVVARLKVWIACTRFGYRTA
jgi:hypothetical protein